MAPVYLKLALNFPLLFLLAAQILQPVAGQASPAPTPCKGAAISADKIKDGYIYREGLSPPLDPGLARTLPYEGKKSNTWTNTSVIPIDCKVIADGKCSLANMEVYDALYFQSCTIPWTICRCTQSEMSQANTRDPFGMIGAKLRSYVRHVMAFPSPLDGWTYNQNIIFYGSAGSQTVISNFIHQATHAMDAAIGNFSSQADWKEAVDKDSCVADQTAAVSYSEAFAQAMVVHIYAIHNNTFTVDTSCMSNQLDILQKLYPYNVLFPKSCDLAVKPPASKTVAKNSDDGTVQPPNLPLTATSDSDSSRISPAAIAGIVIGSFAFGILITFTAYLYWRRRRIADARSQGSAPPKVEESSVAGMTYPMPWATQGNESTPTVTTPSPRRQKNGQYQTPPTRYEDSSDGYNSRQSPEGTTFTSRSPPSYLAATSYAGSG